MDILGCAGCGKCRPAPKTRGFSDKLFKDNSNLKKIILVGNPNVGKSVLFGALTGVYAEVSNYPGTTVSVTKAKVDYAEIIDTPGTYSLGNFSEDERVTKEIIEEADVVVNIVAATSLERDLFLTAQLIDLKIPLVVVVNQVDEAHAGGIDIDFQKLEEELGCSVFSTVATRKQGITEVIDYLRAGKFKVSDKISPSAKKIFEGREITQKARIQELLSVECSHLNTKECDILHNERINFVNSVIRKSVIFNAPKKRFINGIEHFLFNPVTGFVTSLFVLYLLFEIVGVYISGNVVDYVYGGLEEHFCPVLKHFCDTVIKNGLISEIIAGEFGVFTMALSIIVGVLIPLLTAFYIFMSILEDSGYLPRMSVFCFDMLKKIGLNGRAVIPLILGLGCTTMGTITTRILPTDKERMITTALLGISIPCAAQQGIIVVLIASIGGLQVWFMYLFILLSVLAVTGTLLSKIVKGKTSDLFISLPPIRVPSFSNILRKTYSKMVSFLKEATGFFVVSSIIISIMNYFGWLKVIEKCLKPIIVNLLHLPGEFSNVFIMGLIRRDLASAGLFEMASVSNMTPLQIFVAAVVITLFVPCIAMLIMVFKERGIKEGVILWLSAFCIAIGIGSILTRVCGVLF